MDLGTDSGVAAGVLAVALVSGRCLAIGGRRPVFGTRRVPGLVCGGLGTLRSGLSLAGAGQVMRDFLYFQMLPD